MQSYKLYFIAATKYSYSSDYQQLRLTLTKYYNICKHFYYLILRKTLLLSKYLD